MTFYLSFELDYKRIMSAVINDARSIIPVISGQNGNAIYAYSQTQIALVVPGVLVYRITTQTGNLAGFCAIQVQGQSITTLFYQLRPAFVPFQVEILGIIATFIEINGPLQDILY